MMLNKKWLFILLTIIILTLPGCSKDSNEVDRDDENTTMYIATDIHYLAASLTDGGKAYKDYLVSGDGRQLNYIEVIVSAFANDISKKQPDILIISGDLTNNGEKESHIKLSVKLKEIEESGTSVYVIPGNHDILNPWARRFQGEKQYKTDTVNTDEFINIYEDFGFGEAISKDKNSLSYLAAPTVELWLLMLDTNEYVLNEEFGVPTTNGMISDETFQWIKECCLLAKEKHAQIVTVMHHNLFKHNERLYYGFTLDNSDEAVDIFHECGLNLILSGHIHVQDIKSRVIDNTPIYDIVTSTLCAFPQQYGILKYIPSEGFDYSTARVDVEGWAKETGINEDNLINFTKYSKDYFKQGSYNKTYRRLSKLGIYSEEEIKLMSETVSVLNTNYFAGTIDSIKNEVVNSQGYKLWLEASEPEFLKEYVINIFTKEGINNKIYIPVKN